MAAATSDEIPFNIEAVAKAARKSVTKVTERKIAGVHGLYLTIHPSGIASFTHRYQVGNGKSRVQRRSTLGRHGVMTLAEAKQAAVAILSDITKGQDPVGTKRAKSKTMTVGELFELRVKSGKALKPSTVDLYRVNLKVHGGKITSRPIGEVTRRELAQELSRIERDASKFVAHNVRAALGSTFKFAAKRDMVDEDPTLGLGFTVNARDVARERRFTEAELRALWAAFNGEAESVHLSNSMKRILQLLMLTGQRESNVCGAKISEFSGLDTERPIWRIPGARMKKGREQVVALSSRAAAIVRDAVKDAGRSEYLFPADSGRAKGGLADSKPKVPHIRRDSVSTAMDRMRAHLKPETLSDARVHDLRKAITTWLADNGVASFEVRQAILAHQRTDTMGQNYEFATYEKQMRVALEKWGDWIAGEAEAATNVVSLRA